MFLNVLEHFGTKKKIFFLVENFSKFFFQWKKKIFFLLFFHRKHVFRCFVAFWDEKTKKSWVHKNRLGGRGVSDMSSLGHNQDFVLQGFRVNATFLLVHRLDNSVTPVPVHLLPENFVL